MSPSKQTTQLCSLVAEKYIYTIVTITIISNRPRRRWDDSIKMGLQEVGWGHGLD